MPNTLPCPSFLFDLPSSPRTFLGPSQEKHWRTNTHLLTCYHPGERFLHIYLSELGDGEKDLECSEPRQNSRGIWHPKCPETNG